ncbi:MAG: AAA family ATPase [Armatimonadota bacterium]|nr:AAA family ATPase [Armatimonadota bacterium]
MKLISLELKNFRQYRSASISFPDGVTGIIGPNGAGKTTILEAIAWTLYGAPAVRGKNETIRSNSSEPNARPSASLTFELGGQIYSITRSLDPSGRVGQAVLEIDGKPVRSGMSEVTEAITSLLGMDYRAFFTSFFTGQKQLEFMAALDGRAREAAISRMLGYDRLTKAREQVNQDRLGLEREIQGLEKGLPDPEDLARRLNDAQERLNTAFTALREAEIRHRQAADTLSKLVPVKDESDKKAKAYENLSRQLELHKAELQRAEERLLQVRAELADLASRRAELDSLQLDLKRYEEAGAEYKRLKALQVHEAERQQLAGQIRTLEAEVERLESRVVKLRSARNEQEKLAAAVSETQTLLSSAEAELQRLREELVAKRHSLEVQIKQLTKQRSDVQAKRNQIAQAGREGACPTCERPLGEELDVVLARFDSQVSDIDRTLGDLNAQLSGLSRYETLIGDVAAQRNKLADQLESLRKEKSDADARVKEYETLLKDIEQRKAELTKCRERLDLLPKGFDQFRFQELQRIGEELRPVRERAVALKAALDREPTLRTEEADLDSRVRDLRSHVTSLGQAIEDLQFSNEQHESISQEFQKASQAVADAAVELERCKGDVRSARLLLDAVEREQRDYEERMRELQSKRFQHAHLRALAEAFDKLRADLNDRIRPELEYTASQLLSVMTDGRYNVLRIDDDYKPVIVDDGEEKPVISGGEDDIVNLALRLAISQMIADRAGQSFSLLILDEVFGSLDETRRQNVVSLLQNLKNRFEQIILITHIESIHDAVDNCLWVEFDENSKTSRIAERRAEDFVEMAV